MNLRNSKLLLPLFDCETYERKLAMRTRSQRHTRVRTGIRSPESKICKVYNRRLRRRGWKYYKGGPDDFRFIPGSLLDETTARNVFKNGTLDVHYCNGWTGLAAMIKSYGEFYAPTLITTPTEEEQPPALRRRVSSMVVANDDPPPAPVQANDHVDKTTIVVNNNNDPPIQPADGDEEQANAPPVQTPITHSEILENLRKCRDEVSWLQANPNFPTPHQNIAFKDKMGRAMEALYAQLANYNVVSP